MQEIAPGGFQIMWSASALLKIWKSASGGVRGSHRISLSPESVSRTGSGQDMQNLVLLI